MDLTDDNRSWAEICEEELYNEEAAAKAEEYEESFEEGELRDDSFAVPEHLDAGKPEPSNDVPPWRALLKPRQSSQESIDRECDRVDKPIIRNNVSYAKVVSQGTTAVPSNVQPNLSNDDLSLTSHLDVFHVDSPQKKIDNNDNEPILDILVDEDTMFSPCKSTPNESVVPKNTKRPFMLIDSPARENRDRALHFPKIAKSEMRSDVHTKLEPNKPESIKSESKISSPGSKRELEVNPEILCRRQKQIDYGKNTLGYERYTKLVPKSDRSTSDPKTPPKHLKMSRRAFDGLIKNWRMKLHKWDPVSETDKPDSDHANSDQFSVSSEDPSSYDSSSVRSDSTVSTPKKCLSVAEGEDGRDAWSVDRGQMDTSENTKELWTRRTRKNDKSEDDDYLGCEPLTENCVKACS